MDSPFIWILALCALAFSFWLLKGKRTNITSGSSYELRQKHLRINAKHLRNGYALPQVLWWVAAFTGVLLFIPAVAFIVITVMGTQEPKW